MVVRGGRRGFGDTKVVPTFTAPPSTGLVCDSTGQFTMQNGQWRRLNPGESCSSIGTSTPGHAGPAGGGGVTVIETVCLQPDPSTGITVDLNSPGFINYPDGHAPPPVDIVLAPTEGTGIDYQFFCLDATKISLSRDQRNAIVGALTGATTGHGHDYPWQAITDGDRVDAGQVAYGYSGRWWKDVVAGQSPVAVFTGADGDTKNVYMKITGDPQKPVATFMWSHRPTAFQTVDAFLESLSPISTDQICSMLPVATKIPNPYVAIGSVVLQMSGKCPPKCPTGMLYDAATKTCACPPGTEFSVAANACVPASPIQKWLVPMMLIGGGALVIAAVNKKRKKATP